MGTNLRKQKAKPVTLGKTPIFVQAKTDDFAAVLTACQSAVTIGED